MDEAMSRMMIYLLIFNLIFTPFAYALTQFPDEPDSDQAETKFIDQDKLMEAGIVFTDATEFNLTFGADFVYVSTNQTDYRFKWSDGVLEDKLLFEKKNFVGRWTDSWLFRTEIEIHFLGSGTIYNLDGEFPVYNSTIVNEWELDSNWSRMKLDNNIIGVFTLPQGADNITQAVFDIGVLNMTTGTTLQTSETYDVRAFIDWYVAAVFGYDYAGIPYSLQWIMKGIFMLNVVALVFAVRELTRL